MPELGSSLFDRSGHSPDTLYSDHHADLERATDEVRQLIGGIEEAEATIAMHTGAGGEELAREVDAYLTDQAEEAIATRGPGEEHDVEAALVESALEATGSRPKVPAGEDPVSRLEHDGFGEQVTAGVERLHEEGATLPDGESAAEVVAAIIEEPRISDELDTALQYWLNGATKEQVAALGVDPREVTQHINSLSKEGREYMLAARRRARGETAPTAESEELSKFSTLDRELLYVNGINHDETSLTEEELYIWFKTLPPDEQQRLADAKQEADDIREYAIRQEAIVEQGLETSAPALLRGRLPQELADRVGSDYALGLRQLGSHELDEAQEQLDADGGVDVANLGLRQSFQIIKPDGEPMTNREIAINGYYGAHRGGKFVIAIPITEGGMDASYDEIPDMRHDSRSNPDSRAVNPKYVAGFIDSEGVFYPNENFMRSNEAKLVSEIAETAPETVATTEAVNPYERLTPEQLFTVRDNIADSFVQGVRKYDETEMARASANLAAIQREIEARSLEPQPAHQRGEVDGAVISITEQNPDVIREIVRKLREFDGASDIARAMNGGLRIPESSEGNEEARLQAMELQILLAHISREIRKTPGSEFGERINPYASKTNEELQRLVRQHQETIREFAAEGRDTTRYRENLVQIGQVIQGRQ